MLIHRNRSQGRKGIILMVVLAMLTLFALVGLSFVLVAESQATSSRLAREAESQFRADTDGEAALNLFLGQFLYDLSDTDGVGVFSALRGHSLVRNAYGWVPGELNDKPFIGTGRLHYDTKTPPTPMAAFFSVPGTPPLCTTDAALMNFQYYPVDGFLRDPERPGSRTGPAAAQQPYLGGFNVPYTYPDHNNFYLAAIDPPLAPS